MVITPKKGIRARLRVPGDKSISHRSVMLAALAKGTSKIEGFLLGEDCLSTIRCFQALGIQIERTADQVLVHGKGLHGLSASKETLDVGNSGTTIRLMTGLLAAQPFSSILTGDASIQKRPMDRVLLPLSQMGAQYTATPAGEKLYAPFTLHGSPLTGITYTLPVASAQVKSALILAGLYASGETRIIEPQPTRDHTEIMLRYLGADIQREGDAIVCHPNPSLSAKTIFVPGDISSAAYFMAAALLCPDSEIILENVGLNPTRTGPIDALRAMGADITVLEEAVICGEPVGTLRIRTSHLSGTTIGGADIPRLIDEIPILAVVACFAKGTTVIQDAQELKVKESNRIHTVVTELKKFGAHITETEDGMIIEGGHPLTGCVTKSYQDHRIAMSMAIMGLAASGQTTITNGACADISFPGFYETLAAL